MVVPEFQGRGIAVAATAEAIEPPKAQKKPPSPPLPNLHNPPANALSPTRRPAPRGGRPAPSAGDKKRKQPGRPPRPPPRLRPRPPPRSRSGPATPGGTPLSGPNPPAPQKPPGASALDTMEDRPVGVSKGSALPAQAAG